MKERCQNGGDRVGLAILALAVFSLVLSGCAGAGPTGGVVVSEDVPVDAAPSLETEPTSAPAGGAQVAELVEGNTGFALDLYRTLFDVESNLFYSPHGLASALAMTYAGARGDTEEQMANALHFTLSQTQLHPTFKALNQALVSEGGGGAGASQLHMANSLWGQQGSSFQGSFLDTLAEDYGAGLQTVAFERPEEARRLINQWASDQTEHRIRDLLPPGAVGAETALVLANAVYFDAAWLHPFAQDRTHDGAFTLLDGDQVIVPMMDQTAELGYAEGCGMQAIELPYAGGDLAMVILLPEFSSFDQFAQGLDAAELGGILSNLERVGVRLQMPKFRFDGALGMKNALMALGMADAFGDADFSGIDGTHELFIDEVYHGALVSVDEAGTEAAGTTAVVMLRKGGSAVEQEITVDRPFLLLIRDLETGTILFLGHVVNPAA